MFYDKSKAGKRILSTDEVKVGEVICAMGSKQLLTIVSIESEEKVIVKRLNGTERFVFFKPSNMYHKYNDCNNCVIESEDF